MNKYIEFFKTHEKLILALILVVAGLWAHLAWIGYRDRRDLREQGAAHEKLQSDAAVANARADQAEKDAADLKQILVQTTAQINTLQAAIMSRDRQAVNQQAVDKQLPPDQLAARIQTLAPGGVVTVTTDLGYRLDRPEAEEVAARLELVTPLQADVVDLKAQAAEKDKQVAGYARQVTDLTGVNTALSQELTDTGYIPDKKGNLECRGGQCQVDVKVARDQEAKKHRKWELILTVAGYILGRSGKL